MPILVGGIIAAVWLLFAFGALAQGARLVPELGEAILTITQPNGVVEMHVVRVSTCRAMVESLGNRARCDKSILCAHVIFLLEAGEERRRLEPEATLCGTTAAKR